MLKLVETLNLETFSCDKLHIGHRQTYRILEVSLKYWEFVFSHKPLAFHEP